MDGERKIIAHSRASGVADINCLAPAQADWQLEQFSYNADGTLASELDPEGYLTQYFYDPNARRTITVDPENRGVATVYDKEGQIICTFSGWGSTTNPSLTDCSNWNPATYAGAGPIRTAAFTYTDNGERKTLTDGDNNTTQFIYDGLDRLQYTFYPDPATGQPCTGLPCTTQSTYELLTYNDSSNVLCSASYKPCSKRMRNGQQIAYTYDLLDRMATRSPQNLPIVTYQYTLLGEELSASDSSHSVQWDYDTVGRKKYETNDQRQVTYGYDAAGNRNQKIWPDGYTVSYDYDALDRMTDVWEGQLNTGAHLAHFAIDTLSRRTSLNYAGSASNQNNYYYFEPGNRLRQLAENLTTATLTLTYDRNRAGQIRSVTASDGFFLPQPNSATPVTAYTPNRLNEYAAIAGVMTNYDNSGNLTSWTASDGSGTETYTYDSENRLRTATVGGSATPNVFYDYDPLGRRISKTAGGTALGVGGVTTGYLLDGDDEIAEYNVSAGNWSLLRRYIPGSAVDERIAHVEGTALAGAPTTYYHVNHQGSVLAMTDGDGAITQQLSYDEYGNLSSGSSALGEPYRFAGRRFDPETGLYYYRARYYAPALGRFLQTDPIGYTKDSNLYDYVDNDPLDQTDPTGNAPILTGPGCLSITECATASKAFANRTRADRPHQNHWRSKISGKAQKTQTRGHSMRVAREAVKAAKSPNTERVGMNQKMSTTTGDETAPGVQPDVTVVNKPDANGVKDVNIKEVPSKSQNPADVRTYYQRALDTLRGIFRPGTTEITPITTAPKTPTVTDMPTVIEEPMIIEPPIIP